MIVIILINGYFVEEDAMNYTLKQNYIFKNKEGVERNAIKVHGYFSKLEHAVERTIKLLQLDEMHDLTLQFHDYVEMIKQSNQESVQALKEQLKAVEVGLKHVEADLK